MQAEVVGDGERAGGGMVVEGEAGCDVIDDSTWEREYGCAA